MFFLFDGVLSNLYVFSLSHTIECVHMTSRRPCWRSKQRNGGHLGGVKYYFLGLSSIVMQIWLLVTWANTLYSSLDDGDEKGFTNSVYLKWKTVGLDALPLRFLFLHISQSLSFYSLREINGLAPNSWTSWALSVKIFFFFWSPNCSY